MNQEPCKLYVYKEKKEYQDKTPFYDTFDTSFNVKQEGFTLDTPPWRTAF